MGNPLLDPNARLVVAHRGNAVRAPENTIDALREAVDLGADALEFDVRMTRDGVPVLLHDAELDRTTDRRGRLSDWSLADVQELNAGARFPHRAGAPARIPSLEEVLDTFRDLPLIIEVKELAAVDATERLIRRFGAQEHVVVGSLEADVSARFYRSGLACCASVTDAMRLLPVALLGWTPSRPAFQVLSLTPRYYGAPVPIARMVAAARRAGIATHVWTVNDPAEALRLWEAGVAGILTDDPQAILGARRR
ncbi:MAG: glycerophosphodiester phosphodiesterase family protein [Gemmatimonadaceae bacterium]